MNKASKQEILNQLQLYTGTEGYYRYLGGLLLTDGAKFVAEACGAYWLLDIICSVQTIPEVKNEDLQVCHLRKTGETTAIFTIEDGDNNLVYQQEIPFTDFPLDQMTLWVCAQDQQKRIVMLPSEY